MLKPVQLLLSSALNMWKELTTLLCREIRIRRDGISLRHVGYVYKLIKKGFELSWKNVNNDINFEFYHFYELTYLLFNFF